jgi:hypothetical protein
LVLMLPRGSRRIRLLSLSALKGTTCERFKRGQYE